MNESTKTQYLEFIKDARSTVGLNEIDQKIQKCYGEVPADLILAISKRKIFLQNQN